MNTQPTPIAINTTAQAAGVQASRTPGAGPGRLDVVIKDKPTLYLAYMPFLKNGGLFIPFFSDIKTSDDFQMGSDVFILLSLMNERIIPVAGKIAWITPERAEGNRLPGFGIQFNDLEGMANKKIEAILADSQDLGRPTYTM